MPPNGRCALTRSTGHRDRRADHGVPFRRDSHGHDNGKGGTEEACLG
jgi:hypothetical protein